MALRLHKTIAISDTGMIFNPTAGESFSTNEIGLRIIRLMNEGLSQPEILNKLKQEFTVESEYLERDLSDFQDLLKHFQLVADYE